ERCAHSHLTAFPTRRSSDLDKGRIVAGGSASDVVQQYIAANRSAQFIPIGERRDRRGDGSVRVTALRIENADGGRPISTAVPARSEEHTSELQSRVDLVCRL